MSAVQKAAYFSIAAAIIHFIGETLWHLKFGQFLPMLIVDYIAIGLLLYGGILSLRSDKAVGLLCGAWGFTFCLNYRSLFNRVYKIMYGELEQGRAIESTAYVLAGLLVVSLAMFVITLRLSHPGRVA